MAERHLLPYKGLTLATLALANIERRLAYTEPFSKVAPSIKRIRDMLDKAEPVTGCEVVECWGCPFMGGEYDRGEPWNVCNAPKTPEQAKAAFDHEGSGAETPCWCPLRSGPIAVTMKEAEEDNANE